MSDVVDASVSDLVADYAALHRILDRIAVGSATPLPERDVAELAIVHERVARRLGSLGLRRVMDVADRGAYGSVGCRSLREFVESRMRVPHPGKRLRAALELEPTYALTGERLPPRCPATAAAMGDGGLAHEHVDAVLDVMEKVPASVGPLVRDAPEASLAGFATTLSPREITRAGVGILAHLDPDGRLTDDRDRARQRKVRLGAQDSQLMSSLSGSLTPVTRALFDVVLAAWAAPGMNNPDDERSPRGGHTDTGIDPEVLKAAAKLDTRSVGQRQHDALHALLQAAADGRLPGDSHRGLPAQIIVLITEQQLRERAGIAGTTSGVDLPMSDVVALAAHANMHLAVFDHVTLEPLAFGRSRRLASQSQRFVLFAQYGGCSAPDCPAPFSHCEIHHAHTDWADGGETNVHDLAPACGPHNRAVGPEPGQWETTKVTTGPDRGRYAWRHHTPHDRPPDPPRTNHRHRIDALLHRNGHQPTKPDDPWLLPVAGQEVAEPFDRVHEVAGPGQRHDP